MRSIKSLAIGAGFGFVTLAMFIQGFLPAILAESRTKQVSRAVRTDLGDVKWVRYESSDYTPLEKLGRAVYIREGCWYCHSQYVRPVAGEELRWGPVSEAGEYAFDLAPPLHPAHRTGPDARGAQVRRRLALRPSLGPATGGARLHHAELPVALRSG